MKTKEWIQKISGLRKAGCNIFIIALRFTYYYLRFKKLIIAPQRVIIKNVKKIEMDPGAILFIGTKYRGILTRKDITLINVQGKLIIHGTVDIARGVRIDVSKGGTIELGRGVGINAFTKIICEDKITIGNNTRISWDCHIIDSDFHNIIVDGKEVKRKKPVTIGESVLIGYNSSIHKGVTIPDNCIIAADSIIIRNVKEPGSLVKMIHSYQEFKCGARWED